MPHPVWPRTPQFIGVRCALFDCFGVRPTQIQRDGMPYFGASLIPVPAALPIGSTPCGNDIVQPNIIPYLYFGKARCRILGNDAIITAPR